MPSSNEVIEALTAGLRSAFVAGGMTPVGVHGACWERLLPTGENLFFTIQVDSKATDPFSGGGFRFEVEKTRSARPAAGLNGRAMFFQLLQESEIAQLLAQQNRVIGSLPAPPDAQVGIYPAGTVRQMYLSYFQPQSGFDSVRTWLRFTSTDDIEAWVQLLAPLVAPVLDRAEVVVKAGTRHLGKGSLLQV